MQQVAVDCAAWIKATQFVPLDCAAWTDLLHRLTPMRFLVGNILLNSPLSTNKKMQTVINKQTNKQTLDSSLLVNQTDQQKNEHKTVPPT